MRSYFAIEHFSAAMLLLNIVFEMINQGEEKEEEEIESGVQKISLLHKTCHTGPS
jgi:hypothetical protein